MNQANVQQYNGIGYEFALPYRLFIDTGAYLFLKRENKFSITIEDHPGLSAQIKSGSCLSFTSNCQLEHDNHGQTGITKVLVCIFFDKFYKEYDIDNLIKENPSYGPESSIALLNYFLSIYRAKTNEFWFFSLSFKDVFSYSEYYVNTEQNLIEAAGFTMVQTLSSGTPFLKTEEWYADLFSKINSNWKTPFFLELMFEGENALCRRNYRLAASSFYLATEALFRQLILQYFPEKGIEVKPSVQMMGYYFNNYREIGDPSTLPIRKKDATILFKKVWKNRHDIMHGHDLDLNEDQVRDSREAIKSLARLWLERPEANESLIVEGPFSGEPLSQDPETWFQRALTRYHDKHFEDAKKAAEFALLLDKDNEKIIDFIKSFENKKN